MSDATPAFDFSQFVPGFDFLKNLAAGAAAPGQGAGSVPGLPSLSNWVAPTLSVEEVDKRIQELKTVQYWLEQNGHALKATIQALEVQKMTLSTLRGMNVRMEDLANAFTRNANAATAAVMPSAPTPPVAPPPPAAAPAPATAPATPMTSFFNRMAEAMQPSAAEDKEEAEEAPEPEPAEPVGNGRATPAGDRAEDARSGESQGAQGAAGATAGVIDPLQWWGALTQQFQQIAESAMKDAAQIQMPVMPQMPAAPGPAKSSKAAKSGRSTGAAKATKTATSTGTAAAAAAKKTSGASGTGASRAKASPTPAASAKSASSTAKAAPRKSAAAPTSARRSRG
jgi:hypothetical protein